MPVSPKKNLPFVIFMLPDKSGFSTVPAASISPSSKPLISAKFGISFEKKFKLEITGF